MDSQLLPEEHKIELSVRNQFPVTVKQIVEGAVNSGVIMDPAPAPGMEITAAATGSSVE